MSVNSGAQKTRGDGKAMSDALKWTFIVILIAGGVVANYYYSDVAWALRAAGLIVLACAMVAVAAYTEVGRRAWGFAKNARGELRKVVWPTRQETVQTTLIIVGMVIIMALLLWGIDAILLWIIGLLTG